MRSCAISLSWARWVNIVSRGSLLRVVSCVIGSEGEDDESAYVNECLWAFCLLPG